MGKRGPKPTPSAVKRLRGTHRKDRVAAGEACPVAEIPEAPEWLSPEALAEWEYIAPLLDEHKLLTKLDRGALAFRCETYAIAIRAARAAAAAGGVSAETGAGGEKTSPAVRVFKDFATLARNLDAEFGLTPASRTRVSPSAGERKPGEEEEPTNPLDRLIQENERRLRGAGVSTN